MSQIFISYRRADSADIAGRIHDQLSSRFGANSVFRDVNDIRHGDDFVEVLQREIVSCNIMLVTIGTKWLTIQDNEGRRRLDDPEDLVRIEVQTALMLPHVRVIPVLVNGAVMPPEHDLPDVLRDLHRRNAIVIRNEPDFGRDIRAFMDDIQPILQKRRRISPKQLTQYFLFALVSAVIISVLLFVFASIRPPPSNTPLLNQSLAAYEIGLVVAYFQVDPALDAKTADALIDQVYLRLESELSSFTEDVGFTLGLLPPNALNRIEGQSPIEREESARLIAQQYAADIVLYGTVSKSNDGEWIVQPEFYVYPDKFREALEITGSYRLGRAITITGQLNDMSTLVSVNHPLGARTVAMAELLAGLVYYAAEDFDSAQTIFQQVLDKNDWDDSDGTEILHVLLGNAHLSSAIQDLARGKPGTDVSVNLSAAQLQYEQAIEVASNFSRAYAGLAAYYYVNWNQILQVSGLSLRESLQLALDNLALAEAATDKPLDVGVRSRTLLTRLLVNYALYKYNQSDYGESDLALLHKNIEQDAEQIIRSYDNGRQPAVQDLASEAYAILGQVAQEDGNCRASTDHFINAIRLSIYQERKMFLNGWLGDCYAQLGDTAQARQAYLSAIEIADQTNDEPALEVYQDALAALEGA